MSHSAEPWRGGVRGLPLPGIKGAIVVPWE